MGFNKRYISMSSIITQWEERYNVTDVIKYVTSPDTIILLGNSIILSKIVGMCTRNEQEELTKLLKSYIYKG